MSTGVLQKLDRAQKSSTALSVVVATYKKFSEDHSANLAAMIAFWAFFSVFPLFLVLVTLLAIFLPTSDKNSVLGHVAEMFPLLDPKTVNGLSGAWWTIVLGLATALWSGSGVVGTAQFAFTFGGSSPTNSQVWSSRSCAAFSCSRRSAWVWF